MLKNLVPVCLDDLKILRKPWKNYIQGLKCSMVIFDANFNIFQERILFQSFKSKKNDFTIFKKVNYELETLALKALKTTLCVTNSITFEKKKYFGYSLRLVQK